MSTCAINGCSRPHKAKGLCRTHYMRSYHHGDPMFRPKRPRGTALERFDFWVDKAGPILDENLGPCWLWRGKPDKRGYGRIADDTGWYDMAHRWSYKHFVGPIPTVLVIDHKCFNPPCVNPEHLEPVTYRVNTIDRGRTNASYVNSLKTHCKWGHEFSPTNTYMSKGKYGYFRVCKTCHKARIIKYQSRLAAKVAA